MAAQKEWRKLFADVPLSFSDHVFYGLAGERGVFDNAQKPEIYDGLLGWYNSHGDPVFDALKTADPMWSMCQDYFNFQDIIQYWAFMVSMCETMDRKLPKLNYWTLEDESLLRERFINKEGIEYFKKYQKQLDFTERKRFSTMYKGLQLISEVEKPVLVETGIVRDPTPGGGHSTYKFGEFAERRNGSVHSCDINDKAVHFAKVATFQYKDYISYYCSDSVQFLDELDEQIDFLYLDSFDSGPGQEEAASQHQLSEIKAVFHKLKENCVVLLDDAGLPEGGKTKYSSQFLEENGFRLELEDYQKLYVRGF